MLADWKKYRVEHQGTPCYLLTKKGLVRYGKRPGIDPNTGRQCRPYSPEMLVRLREYEQGNRPRRIDATNPVFLISDQETGCLVREGSTGNVESLSLMVLIPIPATNSPITKEVAASWKDQQENPKRAPQNVDPKSYVFFDQITGAPRAWYWRGTEGDYEFYDGPGYHPRTGDPLVVLSKDLVLKLQKEAVDQAKRQADIDVATKRAEGSHEDAQTNWRS